MSLLTASERKKAGVLLSVMMLIAGLDALGVASILPFMGVLANPDLVRTNELPQSRVRDQSKIWYRHC